MLFQLRRLNGASLRFEVSHLSTHHAVEGARRGRHMGKNRDATRRIDGRVRQRCERQSQEGIARQDGGGGRRISLWQVGLPRRRSSLSSAGRSS